MRGKGMKSICTKLTAAMIACMFAAALLVSFVDVKNIVQINKADSQRILSLECENKAKEIDGILFGIERSVELLAQSAAEYLEDTSMTPNEAIDRLKTSCVNGAAYTEGAFSVYFCFDPEKYGTDHNFLYVKHPITNIFSLNKSDDPRTYKASTGESAMWYYASANSGRACWTTPYRNSRYEEYGSVMVTSYTVPVYTSEKDFIGILGMDFTLNAIIEPVKKISLYETGYAFLVNANAEVIYHPQSRFGIQLSTAEEDTQVIARDIADGKSAGKVYKYVHKGEKRMLSFTRLRNNMRLALTVEQEKVNRAVAKLICENLILLCIVMITAGMLIFCIVFGFVHPLRKLDKATTEIIEGNMDVDIKYRSDDEIGKLAVNFEKMAAYLREHMEYINRMAYKDAMTGVKNKAAYEDEVTKIKRRMERGFKKFAVLICDLNNLKKVNDSLGHETGDMLIKNACRLICTSFTHSPVFRIGGDEFVVILEGEDFEARADRIADMERKNREFNEQHEKNEEVHMAHGIAVFDEAKDGSYSDVFMRADKAMYENKIAMKHTKEGKADIAEGRAE